MQAATKTPLRADPAFKHLVAKLEGGETLKYCYQCGTCTAACPIARFIDIYRPNKILELAKIGIRELKHSNAFLFCSACTLCSKGCPQGVKVHEIMERLKELAAKDKSIEAFVENDFDVVLDKLAQGMPFPVSYSWIALRPEKKEAGSAFDKKMEKSLLEALDRAKPPNAVASKTSKRVAVVGSGPAGLTAAWELNRHGYDVTVFERYPEAGGMLRVGIPSHRLPKSIVDAEIERIKNQGVTIQTKTAVGPEMFETLLSGGEFDAVFVATGSFLSRKLRLEGETLSGIMPALDLLYQYNTVGSAEIGKRVVIIGGGNVAMDAAGAAMHCGAESVQLFCLESSVEMPAHRWEIKEAEAEGVQINPGWGPKAILGDGQKVTGIELVKCKSVFDSEKKFNPVFDEKTTHTALADTIVSAIGQAPDLSFVGAKAEIQRGALAVDPYTMGTSVPGLFAGGDAASGTASLIEAIVAGKTAAVSVIRYLEECK